MTGGLIIRKDMKQASAFAPGHLTGFFQIWDHPENDLLKGSRGSGVSINQGVHTTVQVEPAQETSYTIIMDGQITDKAFVSETLLRKMLQRTDQTYDININHVVGTPFAAGFGSSGGGAFSLAVALNEALELGLTFTEAAQIAHITEIECKTGLGTVFAAMQGGFGALVKAGGPGFGEGLYYDKCDDLSVVYLHFGPMSTKDALSNPELRIKINDLGGKFVDEIKDDLRPELFMELSRKFTDYVNIKTPRLDKVLDRAKEENIPLTMAMFGEVAFSLVFKEEAEDIASFLWSVAPGFRVDIVNIDDEGTRQM